ncbi:hypothetical protein ALC53_13461 [Atta colombica]|uniref:Uncharacterized protein n=1 Tax=Atta colombica TaxID=520822 RepID=A0A151HYP3_9HYME|nr:hypothetical protein ALC53_13461 [Atta colombica]
MQIVFASSVVTLDLIAAYLVIINQVGSTKIMDTKSMRRGKNLEKKNKLSLGSCGLLLNPKAMIFWKRNIFPLLLKIV